jgi:pSer/pThr/pTyr-binding forkhead associated (FHA) protein
MWTLRRDDGGGEQAAFRLLPGAMKTLGRATRADFILDAALVSRLHCRLTVKRAGDLEIEDLKSTNGTYVNDKRITKASLKAGDEVRIGRVTLTVEREARK